MYLYSVAFVLGDNIPATRPAHVCFILQGYHSSLGFHQGHLYGYQDLYINEKTPFMPASTLLSPGNTLSNVLEYVSADSHLWWPWTSLLHGHKVL